MKNAQDDLKIVQGEVKKNTPQLRKTVSMKV